MSIDVREEEELESIPCLMKSNSPLIRYPEIYYREDKTTMVIYENGERLTIHPDGTKVLNRAFGKEYEVESDDLPSVRINYKQMETSKQATLQDLVKLQVRESRKKPSPFIQWVKEIALDDRYVEVFLPDSSVLYVFE